MLASIRHMSCYVIAHYSSALPSLLFRQLQAKINMLIDLIGIANARVTVMHHLTNHRSDLDSQFIAYITHCRAQIPHLYIRLNTEVSTEIIFEYQMTRYPPKHFFEQDHIFLDVFFS